MQVTPRCQQAIDYARSSSGSLGHKYLSSAHLILGLLAVDCGAGRVLRKAELTQEGLRDYLREHPPSGEQTTRKKGVVVGASHRPGARKAITSAPSMFCWHFWMSREGLPLAFSMRTEATERRCASRLSKCSVRPLLSSGPRLSLKSDT